MKYPLKVAIVESGRHQCEVANAVGISESRLSRIACGRALANLEEKARIAAFFRKDASELFPLNEPGDAESKHK